MQHKSDESLPLYAISKDSQSDSSLFAEIVDSLRKRKYLDESKGRIYLENDTIYFRCNLKEISVLLSEFVNRIIVNDDYSFFQRFDEVWLFDHNKLSPDSGIKLQRLGEPLKNRQKEKIKEVREELQGFDYAKSKDKKLDDSLNIQERLTDALSEHEGISLGESHIDHKAKEFIIQFLSRSKNHDVVTDLYFEFGFIDTQKTLYEEMHQTGIMPKYLLEYLIDLDESLMTIQNKSDLLTYHKRNPFSYLGIVVMAEMQGIKVTPIDHTVAFDSAEEYLLAFDKPKKITKKRLLLMNHNCYEVISQTKRGKYIIFDGDGHNKTDMKFKVPSVNALLDIPTYEITRGGYVDGYTYALLQHNLNRVLLGMPIKKYQTPQFVSETMLVNLKLIYLLELKSEMDDAKWDSKGQSQIKIISYKWTPSTISVFRKKIS